MALNELGQRLRAALVAELPILQDAMSETDSGDLRVIVEHPRIPGGLCLTTEAGEITIGFVQWHTHGELLVDARTPDDVAASVGFVKEILEDRTLVVISHVDGQFTDAWVTYDEASERKYCEVNETLMIGTWSALAR